jgi:hypothetical protein
LLPKFKGFWASPSVSMDSKGRALDNVFIERFWRSLKQEKIYRLDLVSVKEAKDVISEYMEFYNNHRLHQSLGYKKPKSVHFGTAKKEIRIIEDPMDMMDKFNNLATYPQVQPLQQMYV